MVRTKRRRSEYDDLLVQSSQVFKIKEKQVKGMIDKFSEKIHEIVRKRPSKLEALKALKRSQFNVGIAAEEFMNLTFEAESGEDEEMKLSFEVEEEDPERTPSPKKRKKDDPYKVPGVNTDRPAEIFNRTVMLTQQNSIVREEEHDESTVWFDKFMSQRKPLLLSRNEGSSDIAGVLNLSVDDEEDVKRSQEFDGEMDGICACKFTEKASLMLKNCFETIRKIHGGKLSNQLCEIKVMPPKRMWLENNRGRQVNCKVPDRIVFTVAAQPGRKSDVLTVMFKKQTKKRYSCFSFAKYSSTFKNEVQIAVSALKLRDILKEVGKHQSFGILIKNDGGVKKCVLMIIGPSTKFTFTMDVMSMEESNPELANFVPPQESQSGNRFDFEEDDTVLSEPAEAAAEAAGPNDILASIIFNHESLKKDINALKTFGRVGDLHIVKMPQGDEEGEEEYWAEFKTKSFGTEATVPMSKDGVHNITKFEIKEDREEEVIQRPVKLSLQILSNILSLSNMSIVKMDIHELQGVGMFFKFSPAFGQGQVNYYFNQINPENAQIQPISEETQEEEAESFGSFA